MIRIQKVKVSRISVADSPIPRFAVTDSQLRNRGVIDEFTGDFTGVTGGNPQS